MDSQTKVNVDFKPAKRMKKRRELDALVNGKQPPSFRSANGRMRNGKHELLRNDSDSSEIEEFILPEKSLVRKRGHTNVCSLCVTLCWGFLLIICLIAIGGLVWMCITLKRDVDQLRMQLDRVELHNANVPGEFRDIMDDHEKMRTRVSELESGDQGLDRLRENVTALRNQVVDLDASTKSLSQSVANVPQLVLVQSLPQQVKDLSKNVAELGSNLQTTEQSVTQLQEAKAKTEQQLADIDARLQSLQLANNEPKSSAEKDRTEIQEASTTDVTKVHSLVKDLSLVNTTLYTQVEDLKTRYNAQQASVLELFNYTALLNTRVTFLEVRPTPRLPSETEITSSVATLVQNMLEEQRNASKDNDVKLVKAQLDGLITLIQAQISGHERKLSSLSDGLNKVNTSVVDLENATELNVEMVNSKLASLLERLKAIDVLLHSNPEAFKPKEELVSLPGSDSTPRVEELPLVTTPPPTESSPSPSLSTSLSSPEVAKGGLQQSVERDQGLTNDTTIN